MSTTTRRIWLTTVEYTLGQIDPYDRAEHRQAELNGIRMQRDEAIRELRHHGPEANRMADLFASRST